MFCWWFCLTSLLISFDSIIAPFNLHKTNTTDSLEFDCLEYYVNEREFRGKRFKYPTYQKIRYCRRPISPENNEITDVPNIDGQSFSFETLRKMNVTTNDLLLWSASIDQIEKYSFYINRPSSSVENPLDSEEFINCTSPWFGLRCEYSFDLGKNLSFTQVVEITFQQKANITGSRHRLTNLTCFQWLTCDRGTPMCLDWREICNGHVDCQNGAIDEEHCWQLEINECEEDEYRCHNGLCIPKDFLNDDRNNPDCLDRTDEKSSFNVFDSCFQDPTFRCEEHTCHPSYNLYPCGDGQCEGLLHSCKSHREKLFEDSILQRGNLTESCWLIMSCSTKLHNTIDGKSCDLFKSQSNVLNYLGQCESIFQYPIHPIIFGHVRFFYFNNRTDFNFSDVFQPDLICYDQSLCDTLKPSVIYANQTCQRSSEIFQTKSSQYLNVMKSISRYFDLCSSTHKRFDVIPKSIYQCKQSSKFISTHRLLDSIRNCPLGDDETYEQSCSLNDSYRFKCNTIDQKCFSPIYDSTVCNNRTKTNYTQISFHEFCDGSSHSLVEQIDHYNHTDETDCQHWPCSNLYTRCDDIRHCPNAEDEWNCFASNCSIGYEPCISPTNHQLTCIPYSYVQNGKIDCLGASDEFHLCATKSIELLSRRRYRCWNHTNTQCTAAKSLCDGTKHCTYRDDENICPTKSNPCSKTNGPLNRDILCQLFDREVGKRNFFMLENITEIRLKTDNDATVSSTVLQVFDQPKNPSWSWLCNRGLYARYRHSNGSETYRCFCPPSYYGDSCQYQNERISLTLGFLATDQYQSYTIVVGLVDETNTTIIYDQFPFMGIWGCYRSFNIYLNYPTRPKNLSNSYHLHIDAFDRDTITYLASWKLNIKFPFLPVNRVVSQLILPVQPTHIVHSCPLKCLNGGQCRQYINSADLFCHCPPNWFGSHCEKPVDCSYCSSNSLCLGSLTEQATCLCPLDRTGPRCSIPVSCQTNSCMNDGRCILIDNQLLNNDYICICSEPFYGTRCELSKIPFTVSLEQDEFISYVLVHAVTTSIESEPVTEVMIRKIVPGQSSVKFYLKETFHLIFIQLNHRYYLAKDAHVRCSFIDELINDTEKAMARVRLIKNYPLICSRNIDLSCFFDGYYMCLCTNDRYANCFEFNHNFDLTCRLNDYCENGGSCYQDHQVCPSSTICICTECYFGARCQYYAESLGVTLDDILRYEFRRHSPFSQQNSAVIFTVVVTAIMFVIGSISSFASFVTFRGTKVQQVGCGLYLLMASIISFLTILILFIKVWFLVGSQLDSIQSSTILRIGCTAVEPILKVMFCIDNWLKACVAIERWITVVRGVNFNKSTSKRIAKWMTAIVPFLAVTTTIHEPIYRRLIEHEEGQHRNWCMANYSIALLRYNSIIIIIHFLVPFLINVFSTIFIIVSVARQRMLITQRNRYRMYLWQQLSAHKHTLISPIILILLSLPRLIISLVSNCIKASHDPWLYLIAYFISFTPLVLMFFVFVLPSDLYHAEFKKHFNKRSNVSS